MALRIYVSVEYGYQEFLWIYPGTKKQLVEDYVAGLGPFDRTRMHVYRDGDEEDYDSDPSGDRGDIHEVGWIPVEGRLLGRRLIREGGALVDVPEQCINDYDAYLHRHEEDDSSLEVAGIRLEGLPGRVTLDAVTALVLCLED